MVSGTASTHPAPRNGLAARYAEAFYSYAEERSILADVLRQAASLAGLIEEDAALRGFLADRAVNPKAAVRAIDAVLEARGFGEGLRQFVGVIAANRRLARLPEILAAVAQLDARRRGEVVADVRTAQALSTQQRADLTARLAEAGYGRVKISETVEPALLGGLTVRIGAHLFDTSVRGRLTRLSHAMKGAA